VLKFYNSCNFYTRITAGKLFGSIDGIRFEFDGTKFRIDKLEVTVYPVLSQITIDDDMANIDHIEIKTSDDGIEIQIAELKIHFGPTNIFIYGEENNCVMEFPLTFNR